MMVKSLISFAVGSLFITSCSLDGFLFNTETVTSYRLPENHIPDSLLTEVSFDSEGNRLYGYWVDSDGTRPGLALLYCHGNKHNLDEYWDRAQLMHKIGLNLLIFDYRGFGKSEGDSDEESIYADARAALAFVRARGFIDDSIAVMGYSLGNVPAIYLAAEAFRPRCLISESPFASANSMTQGSLALDIPAGWLTEGKFDNSERIRKITTPLLLLHGSKDSFVRWRDNGKVVFENAPEPKRLILVPDANHKDIPVMMGEDEYVELLREWIE